MNHSRSSAVDHDRAVCACLSQALGTLRLSIANGRPMSLPNAIRLCQRLLATAEVPAQVKPAALRRMQEAYRRLL